MVAPTGVPARMDVRMPAATQNTERTAEQRVTARKLLNCRMADMAGKITKAEISKDPTRFMAITITTAGTTARIILYTLDLVPVAEAKLSSKVTEKIL